MHGLLFLLFPRRPSEFREVRLTKSKMETTLQSYIFFMIYSFFSKKKLITNNLTQIHIIFFIKQQKNVGLLAVVHKKRFQEIKPSHISQQELSPGHEMIWESQVGQRRIWPCIFG